MTIIALDHSIPMEGHGSNGIALTKIIEDTNPELVAEEGC
jgi:hypothetical protein